MHRYVVVLASMLAWSALGAAQAAEPAPPAGAPAATSTSTLDKVRKQGFVACGSPLRPGLAMTDGKGDWSGLEVEICRAVAIAALGDAGRYSYHAYESERSYDAVRSGEDQLSFLSFAELNNHRAVDKVLPGPPVFVESLDMLVAEASAAKGFGDLAGKGICFAIGTSAENELAAWFHDHHLEFVPYPFQEDGEEIDTFNVQKCQGIVGESTYLGDARRDHGVNQLKSRYLAEHFASYPILATTPLSGDAQWAAIVAWTIDTLINADARQTDFHASGLRAMAVPGAGLGLREGWQKAVVDRVGSYSAIFRRTLGAGSPLKLDPGLNKSLADGGVLVAPLRD